MEGPAIAAPLANKDIAPGADIIITAYRTRKVGICTVIS